MRQAPVVLNGIDKSNHDGDIDWIGDSWGDDNKDFGATC